MNRREHLKSLACLPILNINLDLESLLETSQYKISFLSKNRPHWGNLIDIEIEQEPEIPRKYFHGGYFIGFPQNNRITLIYPKGRETYEYLGKIDIDNSFITNCNWIQKHTFHTDYYDLIYKECRFVLICLTS